MDSMSIQHTPLPGLCLVESVPKQDQRGSFERIFCAHAMAALHPFLNVSQANLSTTIGRGSLRGLHFQKGPALEAKLVRCLRGKVFDVAVDLRTGSPTFLKWHAVELFEGSNHALFIPEGFAHGFQVLSEEAQLLYFHTAAWSSECEGGIRHDDPAVSIRWPLAVASISDRDQNFPLLDSGFPGLPV